MNRQIGLGVASGVAAGAAWGLVFLAPQVLSGFTPLQLAAARYLAYGALAAMLLAPRWAATTRRIGRAEWTALVWLSLLGNIVYYVLLAAAVQWAGGPSTSLIIGLLPVVVTLVGSREEGALRLSALAAPLALCVLGVGLVGFEAFSIEAGHRDPILRALGLLCAFGALASWSFYSVFNARWLVRLPNVSSYDWSLLTGLVTGALALALAVPAFLFSPASHEAPEWARFWAIAATVAVLASVVGNGLWNRASRMLPLTLGGQMIVFETLFALLYVFLWDRRWPTGLEAAAMACLVAGVVWCASLHRQREPAAA